VVLDRFVQLAAKRKSGRGTVAMSNHLK
jgi:hypothetical protein